MKSFAHLFTQSVKKKFSDGHLWFSVFSRPVRSNFTRLQRISCCISLLFCTMISNAMFYRQETDATKTKSGVLLKLGPIEFTLTQLWVSFIGTLVVLPVNLIIVTLFRKAKYSQKTLITYHFKAKNEQTKKTKRFVRFRLKSTRKFIENKMSILDFLHEENVLEVLIMNSNALLLFHRSKIQREHFHIGRFTSLGLVRNSNYFHR